MQTEDLRKRADNWVAAELRGGAAFLEDTLTDDFAGAMSRGIYSSRSPAFRVVQVGGEALRRRSGGDVPPNAG